MSGQRLRKEILLDGKRASVLLENGRHTLITEETGRHSITVHFSLKNRIEQGLRAFSFPVPRTPITGVELSIPVIAASMVA